MVSFLKPAGNGGSSCHVLLNSGHTSHVVKFGARRACDFDLDFRPEGACKKLPKNCEQIQREVQESSQRVLKREDQPLGIIANVLKLLAGRHVDFTVIGDEGKRTVARLRDNVITAEFTRENFQDHVRLLTRRTGVHISDLLFDQLFDLQRTESIEV